MIWPTLTVGILTCRRPWYSILTLNQWKAVGYAGKMQFHIADGGSNQEDFNYYREVAGSYPISFESCNNMSEMVNSCAHHGGDLWICTVDDFVPRFSFDITPDVNMLLHHPEIGCVRLSRLAHWGSGGDDPETSADLVHYGGLHWWRIDKARSKDSYICNIGTHLYHRRFWEAYGDLDGCEPDNPGHAEMIGAERFRLKAGPTVAVPMRFGQESVDFQEPIWHLGVWRTNEYARRATTGRL